MKLCVLQNFRTFRCLHRAKTARQIPEATYETYFSAVAVAEMVQGFARRTPRIRTNVPTGRPKNRLFACGWKRLMPRHRPPVLPPSNNAVLPCSGRTVDRSWNGTIEEATAHLVGTPLEILVYRRTITTAAPARIQIIVCEFSCGVHTCGKSQCCSQKRPY